MEERIVNGYRVLFEQTDSPIVDVRVIVNAGSSRETPEEYGAAHYLEHMAFKGTKRRSYKEVNRLGAKLGYMNAHTGFNLTSYMLGCLPEDLGEAIKLLAELFFEPAMPEDEFERERTVILEELKASQDDPHTAFWRRAHADFLGDQFHDILGTGESLKSMKVDTLRRFREQNYTRGRTVFSVIGNVDRDGALKALQDVLPHAATASSDQLDTSQPECRHNAERLDVRHPAQQSAVALLMPGFAPQQSRERKGVDDVLANILGGGLHSKLGERIREELGLAYSVFAASWTNMFGAAAYLSGENVDKAMEEMRKILAEVRAGDFDDELLELAKRQNTFHFARRMQTSIKRANTLAESWFALGGSTISFEELKEGVESLTRENVMKAADELLIEEPKVCVMTQGE